MSVPSAAESYVDPAAIMAQSSAENFPVALRILRKGLRTHLMAIYGFARLVDDLGDEYEGDRSAALNWVEDQLDSLFAGAPRHPIFQRLVPLVEHFEVSRRPFDDLVAANRQDQRKFRYESREELLRYCSLSANPVGRLVLVVLGVDTPARRQLSDQVCSGLQILEHLQDVGEDARAGRIYLPAEDMNRFSCSEDDLVAQEASNRLRELVAFECRFARQLLLAGHPLVRSLRGSARLAISGFVAGGLAGVEAIEKADHEVLAEVRRAKKHRLFRMLLRTLLGFGPRGEE